MNSTTRILLAALSLVWLANLTGCEAKPARPNVILLSIDCMNQRQFEEVRSSGLAKNLAALASESTVFTRAYAHAPWTTPSHMSMLTGLYPNEHGRDIPFGIMMRYGRTDERAPRYATIADRLGSIGYETIALVGEGSISGRFGLAQGFSRFEESTRSNPAKSDLPLTIERFHAWFEQRDDRPFFLFLHTYDLHYPIAPSLGNEDRAIEYIDRYVGEITDALRKQGIFDDTLILVTGDHGSHMKCDHACCLHGAGHYDENLRVPLLVKGPGGSAQRTSDALVRHIDFLPTVLALTGLPRSPYDGSGLAILGDDGELFPDGSPTTTFSIGDGRCAARAAIATATHKYIYTLQDPISRFLVEQDVFYDQLCQSRKACSNVPEEEFYDLRADSSERDDLLARAAPPTEALRDVMELREELGRHLDRRPRYGSRDLTVVENQEDMDPQVRESLRSLGYLQ